MKRSISPLLALFVVAVSTTFADTTWTKEPNTVLGIVLGAPFPATIPDCPKASPATQLCVASRFQSSEGIPMFELEGLPFESIHATANAFLFNGRVWQISISTSHDSYRALKRMLVDRYGDPLSENTRETGEQIKWFGTHTLLSLTEGVAGRPNESLASFIDIALGTQAIKANKDRSEHSDASKF